MQSSGHVAIYPKDNSGSFTVPIMDDNCRERHLEFIQVTVSIPGSASLQGETLSTRIRIDDDDYEQEACDYIAPRVLDERRNIAMYNAEDPCLVLYDVNCQ